MRLTLLAHSRVFDSGPHRPFLASSAGSSPALTVLHSGEGLGAALVPVLRRYAVVEGRVHLPERRGAYELTGASQDSTTGSSSTARRADTMAQADTCSRSTTRSERGDGSVRAGEPTVQGLSGGLLLKFSYVSIHWYLKSTLAPLIQPKGLRKLLSGH